jgi:integrase
MGPRTVGRRPRIERGNAQQPARPPRLATVPSAHDAPVAEVRSEGPAVEFGPNQLRVFQTKLAEGRSRKTANSYVANVCQIFSWAVGRGLIPATVADALTHVPALARGRSSAIEHGPVVPARDAQIEAVIPHLHADVGRCRIFAAMVRLQRLTGMRPGEVCGLVPRAIDRSREPWLYLPPNKTLHLDKDRRVFLGPGARAILAPLLEGLGPDVRVFRLPNLRGPGEIAVTTWVYRQTIADACKAAGVPLFKPNQVRKAKAMEIQRLYESDKDVAAALGNTPEVARQVYVEHPADAVAKRIAESTG